MGSINGQQAAIKCMRKIRLQIEKQGSFVQREREILRRLCTPPEQACPLIIQCFGTAQDSDSVRTLLLIRFLALLRHRRLSANRALLNATRSAWSSPVCICRCADFERLQVYFAFKPCLGGDFCSVLKKKRKLPLKTARYYMAEVRVDFCPATSKLTTCSHLPDD